MANTTNVFLEDWKAEHLKFFRRQYPQLSKEQILSVLESDIKENFKDPDSMLHNDYMNGPDGDDLIIRQKLSLIYRFCKERKPIMAGNGTLFYNQNTHASPIADLIDERIAARKHYQKLRDQYPQDSDEYQYYDMMQAEAKIRINSIYGSFGAPTFQLYNRYTAAATTGTAQSLISTTAISFEAFIGDNVKFKTFAECMVFIHNIVDEEYKLPKRNIKQITDVSVVYDRLKNNFEKDVWDEQAYGDILWDLLDKLDIDELTHIYYKNNLYEFIQNEDITHMIVYAFNKIDNFNDPNKVPDNIQEDMNILWDYCAEYVFYNHAYNERIARLKRDERAVVKLIDTDSNLINVQPWVDFLDENIIPKTKTSMKGKTMMFACVNTLAFLVTSMLRQLLDRYGESANVLERYWKRLNMKNEFCFAKLLLAPTKKRYVAKIILKEGKPIIKTEIKGHDFKKAGVTEYVSGKMVGIVENRILEPEKVDTAGILRDLNSIEKEIYESLRQGERKFLLRMNCKDPIAYKNPMSMGQVLSVLAWNTIYPGQEIMVPDKLDVVLVRIPNEQAIAKMKETHPTEYHNIVTYLLNGPEPFKTKGIKYLAIPNNIDGIPEFIRPYIDYDYISARNLGTFRPITESLGFDTVGNSDIQHFSNIRYNTEIEI